MQWDMNSETKLHETELWIQGNLQEQSYIPGDEVPLTPEKQRPKVIPQSKMQKMRLSGFNVTGLRWPPNDAPVIPHPTIWVLCVSVCRHWERLHSPSWHANLRCDTPCARGVSRWYLHDTTWGRAKWSGYPLWYEYTSNRYCTIKARSGLGSRNSWKVRSAGACVGETEVENLTDHQLMIPKGRYNQIVYVHTYLFLKHLMCAVGSSPIAWSNFGGGCTSALYPAWNIIVWISLGHQVTKTTLSIHPSLNHVFTKVNFSRLDSASDICSHQTLSDISLPGFIWTSWSWGFKR